MAGYKEVVASFEATFQDKQVIPDSLEKQWFKMAVARYNIELSPLVYDEDLEEFDEEEGEIDQYTIDTLAQFMKQFYQEREVSKINKRISIVGKDLSYDGSGQTKKYAKEEMDYVYNKSQEMIDNQKPPAYS